MADLAPGVEKAASGVLAFLRAVEAAPQGDGCPDPASAFVSGHPSRFGARSKVLWSLRQWSQPDGPSRATDRRRSGARFACVNDADAGRFSGEMESGCQSRWTAVRVTRKAVVIWRPVSAMTYQYPPTFKIAWPVIIPAVESPAHMYSG